MQQTVFEPKIGELLFKLATASPAEKSVIKLRLDEIIKRRYPRELSIFSHFIDEAYKGNLKTTLGRGILIPNFSNENIISTIKDNRTIVEWA